MDFLLELMELTLAVTSNDFHYFQFNFRPNFWTKFACYLAYVRCVTSNSLQKPARPNLFNIFRLSMEKSKTDDALNSAEQPRRKRNKESMVT